MGDDVTEHFDIEEQASSVRMEAVIDLQSLVDTGKASFELKPSEDLTCSDDGDDGNDEETVETDRGGGGGTRRSSSTRNSFEYLKDLSTEVFSKPPNGTVIQDLLSDGSIMKYIVREGQGVSVPDNCKVYVHYVIATIDARADEIDSTLSTGRLRPECIDLRNATVLPGFYLALKSMTVLEVAKFLIRYDKAFGEIGCPPRVPPFTDVVCTIEVISVLDGEKLSNIEYMDREERRALPFSKVIEFSSKKKHEGNQRYKENDFGGARRAYFKGANILEDYPVLNEADNEQRLSLLFSLYSNLAQCCNKMENWAQSCVVCKKGLGCSGAVSFRPAKIYYRFAIAQRNLGDPNFALELINKALILDPGNRDIRKERENINQKIQEEKDASKLLMSRMGRGVFEKSNK